MKKNYSNLDYLSIEWVLNSKTPVQIYALISPDIARVLLEYTIRQRKTSTNHLRRYARDMSDGCWYLGDPITFAIGGGCINGIHRLKAIIKSNTTQAFSIQAGYPKEAISYIDCGKPRTSKDDFDILGVKITRRQIAIINGWTRCKFSWSRAEIQELYQQFKDGIDFASYTVKGGDRNFRLAVFETAIARAYYYEDLNRLRQFQKILQTGFPIEGNAVAGDRAAFTLRNNYSRTDSSQRRYERALWINRSEEVIYNFCDFSKVDSPIPHDIVYYPLPGIDDNCDDTNIDRMQRFPQAA